MILLTAEHIKKSYTEKPLITNVNLSIDSGDKIGLIGVNGTGKSTLLKIIAGAMEAEDGTITKSRELRPAYLPQNPDYDPELTIEEQTAKYLEAAGGVTQQYECNTVLTKLDITDYSQKMGELSGGQRKRVAMAAVLASESNLLILDEPTNHLDSEMIKWLENYLINYKGAVFMITHDRYFLDRITNRIVEIENGVLYNYDGNYDYYLTTKESRMEMTLATERKRQAIYRKELAWIRRGAQARTTKAKGRIQRFHQLEENKLVIDDTKLELTTASSRLGKKIIEIKELSKAYGDQTLIKDFNYTLLRDDRVGIIGANGCGKSTLLNIIMGQIPADEGMVEKGETVKIGYFSQENQALDDGKRVIKFIADIAENVRTSEGSFSASQMLERFLFPPHMHSVEVGRLSGGEKRRLYLLSILMQAPNVLILDEPTNDLDIETLTILEDYLDDFAGAVIVVSHDRYFLDRVVRRTFAFEGEGRIKHYNGGYTDYEARKAEDEVDAKAMAKAAKSASADGKAKSKGGARDPNYNKPKKLKFTFKEQKEYETIEEDIMAMEERIEDIEKAMKTCGNDFVKLNQLLEEKNQMEEALMEKMDRWEYLSELAEKIAVQ